MAKDTRSKPRDERRGSDCPEGGDRTSREPSGPPGKGGAGRGAALVTRARSTSPDRATRSRCWRSRRPRGCPSWCRSGTAGCSSSPFAFYRGGALIMAADLARTPSSGLRAQLCGDAHLSNFGVFASPERTLVFDINDFDETLPGPWEWDVKRLVASFAIAGRELGFSEKERRDGRRSTRRAPTGRRCDAFAGMRNLEVWYSHLPVEQAVRASSRSGVDPKRLKKAEGGRREGAHQGQHARVRQAHRGRRRRAADRQRPAADRSDRRAGPGGDGARRDSRTSSTELIRSYRRTLETDRRHLLEEFRFVDLARKVVGVGSVGTRAWIVLFLGVDGEDPLFLQVKEAQPSVLERFLGKSEYGNYGQRVVAGQRLMQAASDIFLGWQRVTAGLDGQQRDFYVRQLKDWKGSVRDRGRRPDRGGRLREDLRLDARPRARPLGRPGRDRLLPRQRRHLRPGDRRVRRGLRRPERTRLPGAPGGRRQGPGQGRNGPLTCHVPLCSRRAWGPCRPTPPRGRLPSSPSRSRAGRRWYWIEASTRPPNLPSRS